MTIISDPWLGEREVGDEPIDVIKDQRNLLKAMCDDGRRPTRELLYDIKFYDYIISSSRPNYLAEEYLTKIGKLRATAGRLRASKREVAGMLGWKV